MRGGEAVEKMVKVAVAKMAALFIANADFIIELPLYLVEIPGTNSLCTSTFFTTRESSHFPNLETKVSPPPARGRPVLREDQSDFP